MNVMDCSFICTQMSFCLFVTVSCENALESSILNFLSRLSMCYNIRFCCCYYDVLLAQVFAYWLAHGDTSILCHISLPLSWTGRQLSFILPTWKYLQIAILSSSGFSYLQLSSIFFRGFCECIKFYVSDSNFGHIQVSPICRASIMQGLFL